MIALLALTLLWAILTRRHRPSKNILYIALEIQSIRAARKLHLNVTHAPTSIDCHYWRVKIKRIYDTVRSLYMSVFCSPLAHFNRCDTTETGVSMCASLLLDVSVCETGKLIALAFPFAMKTKSQSLIKIYSINR